MAQSSISSYFNVRKRPAVDDCKTNRAKKVLLLDSEISEKQTSIKAIPFRLDLNTSETTTAEVKMNKINSVRRVLTPKLKTVEQAAQKIPSVVETKVAVEPKPNVPTQQLTPEVFKPSLTKALHPQVKRNLFSKEPTLNEIKNKLSRSSRLAELRASISRCKESDNRLKDAEAKTATFAPVKRNIELEVNVSPRKPQSPVKAYLSPKKDTTARKNLFNLLSPTKTSQTVPISPLKISTIKETLPLPRKYRNLAEIFRSIDTICQILYNRKEDIIFSKLKPAVEKMLKRNLTTKHLAQIKFVYPESFAFSYEKRREFGAGVKRETWELVLTPLIPQTTLTMEVVLERRRKLHHNLIEKFKTYHQEFLATLDPPMEIPANKLTHWHPQFDIESVPEIELSELPECPNEQKFTKGSQVLESCRTFLNCNTRMEQALTRLNQQQQQQPTQPVIQEYKPDNLLKGIPKALLEKVRQRQAANALQSMTRSGEQDKEAQLYSHLPEVARLARNLFVSERKNVLPMEYVVDKVCNSYRVFSNKSDMEVYLKTIAKEVTGWLVFHEIRGSVFVKVDKNADVHQVLNKLKSLSEAKSTH